ncbi:hypothetical protein ACERIT_00630 [Halopenitus sp. H-Gu1]|uniref:hypothetical protein n=1 Tax=Halopenitus sp. H-Gu1 TaxID=3242697 RepID=UPI00359D33A2
MSSSCQVSNEESPLVTYSLDDAEQVSTALIEAFSIGSVDIHGKENTLYDQINVDAIDGFDWNTDRHLRLSFPVWDHYAVITPESIEIYATS